MKGYRLVEVLEHGWDVALKCRACEARGRRSKDHFLGPWMKYLNATVEEIEPRLKCPCGAQDTQVHILGGSYAHFGMVSDYFEGRAILIRKTLIEAGLDPAAYGYQPLTDLANARQMP